MKKRIKAWACITGLALIACSLFAACKPKQNVDIDETQTQLYVWNYDGGVGHKWLDDVIERFTAEKAGETYKAGTKGVQIIPNNTKTGDPIGTMGTSTYSVYFLEGVYYNSLQSQNKLLNISDMVISSIEGENKSVESKLSQNTKDALKGYDGNYYALPHYQSMSGLSYNKTMFDRYNWYFAEKTEDYISDDKSDPGYGFIADSNAVKTVGPDGIRNTDDDGLPSSIEELDRLCKYIIAGDRTPFIFFGDGTSTSYQDLFCNALWASVEGYEGAMANFTLSSNGKETNIITEFNGDTPIVTPMKITEDNFYEVYQQESRYYTLDFAQKVFATPDYYHEASLSSAKSHTDIQKIFLESYYEGEKVAMIMEGSYWENEARDSGEYDRVISDYPEAAEQEIRFMPLPVQIKGSVTEGNGRTPTLTDANNSYAFINANVGKKHGAEVERLAKEFLQFCYTDKSLTNFTLKSGVTKNVEFRLSDEDFEQLSYFSKSMYSVYKNAKVVTPISGNLLSIKNHTVFTLHPAGKFWETNDKYFRSPCSAFMNGKSARYYFEQLKKDISWVNALQK